MQTALRPYTTAGVALVGASVIAISPVAAPTAAIEEVRDTAVELSALVNPIDAFRPVFEAATADLQALGQVIGANPAPILAQILANQINGVGNIGAALEAQIGVIPQLPELLGQTVANELGAFGDLAGVGQTFVENVTEVLTGSGPGTLQDQLQEALDLLNQGEYGQAFQFLAVVPLLPLLGNGLSNIELLPPLIEALQQPLADAAKLFPIAAGPLNNAQAALGVLGNPLNALIIGIGALTAIAGVADAAGNTVGGLIDAVQNGDLEAAFNTVVTQAAAGTGALVTGALDPQFGLVAGLQGLREAIAAAITPQAATALVAKAPSVGAQSFTLTTPPETAPKTDTTAVDEKGSGAVDTGTTTSPATKSSGEATSPNEKDNVKGGNLFTPGSTNTKGGRHRADSGPGFAQNLKDAAEKTIKGITGLGGDKKSESSSTTAAKSGESGSSSSTSGGASSGGSSGSK